MRQDVLDALIELLGGDAKRAAEFAALVDGTNREIADGGLVSRETPKPAQETPDPAPEPPVVDREVVLDESALTLITAQFAEMLAPFTEQIEALKTALAGLVDSQAGALDEARKAREVLDTRIKAVERDDEQKHREWLADMPRRETLTVTHRPREANRPENDEPTQPDPSAVLDAAGVPKYA